MVSESSKGKGNTWRKDDAHQSLFSMPSVRISDQSGVIACHLLPYPFYPIHSLQFFKIADDLLEMIEISNLNLKDPDCLFLIRGIDPSIRDIGLIG